MIYVIKIIKKKKKPRVLLYDRGGQRNCNGRDDGLVCDDGFFGVLANPGGCTAGSFSDISCTSTLL